MSETAPNPGPREEAAGLYVHVPFCARICPYCDFAVTQDDGAARARYVDALVAEIDLWAQLGRGAPGVLGEHEGLNTAVRPAFLDEPFDTVYLGGGTPSVLSGGDLERILGALDDAFALPDDRRLFFEANPEDVTPDYLATLRSLGVETLSLGVQSFDPAALKFLGRRHTPDQAARAVALAREADFGTVSLDLIFGLPESVGDHLGSLALSLAETVRLAPDHVSAYQLTFHEGTPFGRALERGRLAELPEPLQGDAFDLLHDELGAAGFVAYEVSNFARSPEHRSRHNTKYWRHVPYLGLGPSAHSFDGGFRWWNERELVEWERRIAAGQRPVAGGEVLSPEDLATETVLLRLRTVDGLDLARFEQRFGVDLLSANRAVLDELFAEGVLEVVDGWLRPTRAGLAVADGVAGALVAPLDRLTP